MRNRLVKNFLSECIVVDPSTPISKAIGLMKENNSYEVFAWIGDKIGTVTVRDILRVKSPASMKVESFLNFVPKLSVNAELLQAAKMMADYRLRALPIVHKNRVIGKVDIKSIVSEVKNSALGNIRVSKIMSPSPITISIKEKISKAREIMLRRKVDHLPVVKFKRVGGIITSTQIVFSLMADLGSDKYMAGVPDTFNPLDYPVEAIMSDSPLECSPQTSIRMVAENMLNQNSSYSLVTLGEEIQGIVTYRDFAKLISLKETKINVPIYMIGLPDDPFEAEAAKIKFIRLIEGISKLLPSIIEARSTVKSSSLDKRRRRYEVNVNIRTARKMINYSSNGWDLPSIYDEIANAIRKIVTAEKRIRRKRRGPVIPKE